MQNRRASRRAAKHIQAGQDICQMNLVLATGKVESVELGGDICRITVVNFQLENHFTTGKGGESVEHSKNVFVEAKNGEQSLVIHAGLHQRISATGLTNEEIQNLNKAASEQLSEAIEGRSEEERSKVATNIVASLSDSEREKLLRDLISKQKESRHGQN